MILISFIADDHAEASVNFNKDTFAEDVEKTPHLVMFYAPWYVFNLSKSDTFKWLNLEVHIEIWQNFLWSVIDMPP